MKLLLCVAPLLFFACTASRPDNPAVTLNPESIAGKYESPLSSANAPGRRLTLDLRRDSEAELSTEFPGKGIVRQLGRWSSLPPQVRFDFRPESGRRADPLTWTIQGDELVPLVWDKAVYGEKGLRLRRTR